MALAFDRSKRYPSLPPRFGYEKSFAVVASSNRQKYRIKLNSSLSLFPFLAWFHETGEQVRSRRPGRPGGGWRTPKRRGAEVLAVPKGTKKKRVRSSVSSASIGRQRERERERAKGASKVEESTRGFVVGHGASLWLSMFARVRRRNPFRLFPPRLRRRRACTSTTVHRRVRRELAFT